MGFFGAALFIGLAAILMFIALVWATIITSLYAYPWEKWAMLTVAAASVACLVIACKLFPYEVELHKKPNAIAINCTTQYLQRSVDV